MAYRDGERHLAVDVAVAQTGDLVRLPDGRIGRAYIDSNGLLYVSCDSGTAVFDNQRRHVSG